MARSRQMVSGSSPAKLLFLLAFGALLAFGIWEYLKLPDAEGLKTNNPSTTALMDLRAQEARAEGKPVRRKQKWLNLSSISKWGQDAVLISEDANFYRHQGIDWGELQNAVEDAVEEGELGRGASTLTQQLAKNLWLSTDRSLVRKAKEYVLARRLEEALPKKRIFTLYLNVVEWGVGIYGIGAAAEEHFQVSAADLTPAQGAILAAMLPAPRKRGLLSHSKALKKRALWVVDNFVATGRLNEFEATLAKSEIELYLN